MENYERILLVLRRWPRQKKVEQFCLKNRNVTIFMPKLTFILLDKIRVVSSIERKFGRCHPFNRFQTVHLTRRCLQSPRQGDDLYLTKT